MILDAAEKYKVHTIVPGGESEIDPKLGGTGADYGEESISATLL